LSLDEAEAIECDRVDFLLLVGVKSEEITPDIDPSTAVLLRKSANSFVNVI